MASLIRDNGLTSPLNRGSFYGCRNLGGQLDAVTLIGHATLIEARSSVSLAALARLTDNCQNAHLIRGDRQTIESFWKHFKSSGEKPRTICNELLLEQRDPSSLLENVADLRPATLNQLDQVMNVNAMMAFHEGGTNPLQNDPDGFRQRTARRIEQGRVWALVQDGELIFKADVIAATPQAVYLEGIHVHPEQRLKGHGRRCLTQLARILLATSKSICLTLSQKNLKALLFYAKAGYQLHSHYQTIYLR
jgi:ribosomal protein S18 acetylase RimI-like enzyme